LNKKSFILLLFIVFAVSTYAQQGIVLSQPYMSSQFLSPASVGNGNYEQRIQSNLKSQFLDGNNLYRTLVSGWDSRFKNADPEQKNYFGVGAQVISDQVMAGLINSNYITLDFAYHLFLDANLQNELSLGLGVTYGQTYLDRSKLRFGEGFNIDGTYTDGNYDYLNSMWEIQIASLDNNAMPYIEVSVGTEDPIFFQPIQQLSKTEVTSYEAVGIKLIPEVPGCPIYSVDTVKRELKRFLVSKNLMKDSDTPFPHITKSQFLRFTSAPSVNNIQRTNWLLLLMPQNEEVRPLTQGEMNWFMCRRYIQQKFIDLRPFNPDETMPHDLGFKDPSCQRTVSIDMLNRLYNLFISDNVHRVTRSVFERMGGKKLTKMK
jgi:hypothetical protein